MKNDQTHINKPASAVDKECINALTNQLDIEAASIDSVMLAKLSAARYRALETDTSTPYGFMINRRAGGFAAVALSVMLVVFWTGPEFVNPDQQGIASNSGLLTDLPILAAEDSVEFYQSLDFLIWLQNESETNG